MQTYSPELVAQLAVELVERRQAWEAARARTAELEERVDALEQQKKDLTKALRSARSSRTTPPAKSRRSRG